MLLEISPEKESLVRRIAQRDGRDARQVIEEAVDRLIEYDASFLAAVEEGRASARRGELLDHAEVVTQIEQFLGS